MNTTTFDVLFWCFHLSLAWLLPLAVIKSTQWLILRASEERLRAIPFSIWQPLYNHLLHQTLIFMNEVVEKLSKTKLYEGLNPERCKQQTMKVLLPYSESLTDQLIMPQSPVLWPNLPLAARAPIYQRVHQKLKPSVDRMVESLEIALSDLFDHKAFIEAQIRHQESGYRFLCTEALIHYWHDCLRQSRIASILGTLILLILATLFPSTAIHLCLLLLPVVLTIFVFSSHSQSVNLAQQKALSRCLGFWLSERIYRISDLITFLVYKGCDPYKLRQLITKAMQPLTEDTPLKTLAQLALGRKAPIELQNGVVDYMTHNATSPFEHTTFNQERAEELNSLFQEHIQHLSLSDLNLWLAPLVTSLKRLVFLVGIAISLLLLLLDWII